ncbi:MAG: FKBP-type peptidyl-prolyl cis-trans isomerase [Bacteroidia bacterium]|nr:FKBP-type peptidyl-prolyl cis-trans isomerase [Bacteroidia bacterium]
MDTIKTQSGLQYVITKSNPNGKVPKAGDKVVVHYTGKLTNDTVFDSSVNRGQPFSFVLGKGQVIKGWDEGIALLKSGEKAVLTIPAELGYGARAAGSIPPNSTLIFDVELIDVIEKIVPKPYETKGKDTLKTASGLKYIMVEEGKGNKPVANKMVSVHYTGFLPDGKIFDSSVERGQPISFMLGVGQVIKGWDEGIQLLNIGSKARLIIPYELGYGERGYPPVIPPKSELMFDVEVVGQQ